MAVERSGIEAGGSAGCAERLGHGGAAPGPAAGRTGERLPSDAVLLPLREGELLVSRSHAVYCRIPAADLGAVRELLAGARPVETLAAPLRAALESHGFFGPPRSAEPESPSVQLQLTNGCNIACTYCCTNSSRPRAGEITFEEAVRVVEEVREALGTGTRVAILGGEPFLVPWAADLAERAADLGLRLTIFSNGIPLGTDDALAARVGALCTRGVEVRISLAGPTRETCNGMSGADRFDGAIRGIQAVARHGGKPVVDLMLMPQIVAEVSEHLPALRKLLPPATKVCLGVLYLSGRETGQHLFGTRSELETALDRIAFDAGETISATGTKPVTERREGCTCALGHHLHVRSDGSLFTCFKMEEKVGHLRDGRFLEVWKELRAQPHPTAALPLCRDCALATLCGGGCRSENLQYTGNPDEPVCGPWRVQVIAELLAEDRPDAVEWPAHHLLAEAKRRGFDAPEELVTAIPSRHLIDT